MSRSAVYILTTEGPVEIQRIIEEDPAVNSVICLDGLTQVLPISPAYEAFVRRPAGIVERMTGHGAYRIDVSARIDEGRSWQLAVYLAHAVHMQGGNGAVIFATGEVDSTLAVRPVEQVEQKLRALTTFVHENGIDPARAVVLLPNTGADPGSDVAGVPMYRVDTIAEALSVVGLVETAAPATQEPEGPARARGGWRTQPLAILLGAALIAAALFWVGGDFARWSALMEKGRILELEQDMHQADESVFGRLRADGFRRWLVLAKTDFEPWDVSGSVYVADNETVCADKTARQKRPLAPVMNGHDAVCAVEISVDGNRSMVTIGRLGYWPAGLGNGVRPTRVMRGSRDPTGRTWTLEFDELPGTGAALRLVVIAGAVDISGPQPWYEDLLAAPLESAAFDGARQRLLRLGFDVMAYDWERQ